MKTVITNGIIITMNRDMDMYPEGYVVLEAPWRRWSTV